METLHGLLYFTLLFSGFGITMYKGFALREGWQIAARFENDGSLLKIFGRICFLGGIIEAFFEFRWWVVILGAFLAWALAGVLLMLLKERAQLTGLLLSIISFIGIFVYQIFLANVWF